MKKPGLVLPYLQLIRLPNLFTAGTQSLAGWLLAGGSAREVGGWLPLVLASMFMYASGVALNDVFDVEIDRAERPNRPLPSGKVPIRVAWVIGLAGLVIGPLLALASSKASALVALGLVAAILGYDLGLRRTVMGPQVMGICRGLNLLMGLAHAPLLSGPAGWIAAAAVSVFVCGFTWISRWETETGRLEGLTAGIILENVALAGLLAVALRLWPFPAHSAAGDRVLPIEGLLILLLVGLFVNQANNKAVKQPIPARMQGAVKAGILSLSWIDAGLVASVVGLVPGLAIVLLWLPAPILAKRIYST